MGQVGRRFHHLYQGKEGESMFSLKKVALGASALLLVFSLFGSTLSSYISTGVGIVSENVKSSVPVEFEIQRLQDLITEINPEINKNLRMINEEKVEIAKLDDQITTAEERQLKSEVAIVRLRDDLLTGKSYFVYASHRYSADQVKTDLSNRVDRYDTEQATLDHKKQIREARQTSLDAAEKKITQMREMKRQLEATVEKLKAQKEMNEVAKAGSEFNFDDSKLGQAKELAKEIETRLEIERQATSGESYSEGAIPLDEEEPVVEDVLQKVTNRFGPSTKDGSNLANN